MMTTRQMQNSTLGAVIGGLLFIIIGSLDTNLFHAIVPKNAVRLPYPLFFLLAGAAFGALIGAFWKNREH